MSTVENKRSVIVGLFIFIGIAIFVAGVFTLGAKQKTFVKSFRIKSVFDDVGGLKTGNNVWFSGVKIGTVKTIKFYGNSQVEITMSIEQEAQKYIHNNAMTKISSDGLIGNKIIVIEGGSPENPEIQEGDILQSEKVLGTDEIMVTLQENNKNLLSITNAFKVLSSNIAAGKGVVGALLTDSLLENNFLTMVASLEKTSVNTAKVSTALAQFSSKLNNQNGLANQVLSDTVVFSNLRSSVQQLHETINSASQITDNLSKTSTKFNSTDNSIGVLLNDPEAAKTLKNTLKNLETSTEKLDENMEALQHNFLLRGFFKRKAKAEQKAAQQ